MLPFVAAPQDPRFWSTVHLLGTRPALHIPYLTGASPLRHILPICPRPEAQREVTVWQGQIQFCVPPPCFLPFSLSLDGV